MAIKYYLATFDLVNSRGRTDEYRRVEESLKLRFGSDNYAKLIKQCAIVRSEKFIEDDILNTIKQVVGSSANILITRITHGSAVSYINKRKRSRVQEFLDGIPKIIKTESDRDVQRRLVDSLV